MLAVDAPELVGVEYGDSQRRMSELFEAALAAPSAIIFIDEIDVVCGHRESAAGEMERRIVSLSSTTRTRSSSRAMPDQALRAERIAQGKRQVGLSTRSTSSASAKGRISMSAKPSRS